MSEIAAYLEPLKNKMELSTAGYIASHLSRKAINGYLQDLTGLTTDEVYLLATIGRSAIGRRYAIRELLRREPPVHQLLNILCDPVTCWCPDEIIEHLLPRIPTPSEEVLECLKDFLLWEYCQSEAVTQRTAYIALGRYVLEHSPLIDHHLTLCRAVPGLENEMVAQWSSRNLILDEDTLIEFLRENYTEEERSRIVKVITSRPNLLPLPVLALLASPLYGNQECWEQFKAHTSLNARDFELILFADEACIDMQASYPTYFPEVLSAYYQLQPDIDRLGKLLLLYHSYSEPITRHFLSRQPTEADLHNIF